MEANMAGDDASLDAAVAMIAKKISPEDVGAAPAKDRQDPRANRDDRDVTEMDDYTSLEDLEAAERQTKAEPAESEGEDGQEEAEADENAILFELPGAAEGEKSELISRKQALEAVQAYRQMNGQIADAVNKAESEYQQKTDTAWTNMVKAHNAVIDRAEAVLAAMPAPQPPPRSMLNHNSNDYDPDGYARWADAYERQLHAINTWKGEKSRAEQAKADTLKQQLEAVHTREHERLSRYLPDWKDTTKREAIQSELYEFVGKQYGVDRQWLDQNLPFHHGIVRAMNDLKTMKTAQAEAPKVKKAIQEKAAKVTNGRLPERDQGTGRFVSDARKELKESGSEDAFAKLLMRSGALKGL